MEEQIRLLRELMPDVGQWPDAWVVGEARDRRLITTQEWYEISKEIEVCESLV